MNHETTSPKEDPTKSRFAGILSANRTLRFTITGILVLFMGIPLSMVESVVHERHTAYKSVLGDISSHWGNEQVLVGPILLVPYTEEYDVVETHKDKEGTPVEVRRRVSQSLTAVILPKRISLDGTMKPEYRRRGIYQSLVYSLDMTMEGRFTKVETQIKSLSSAERFSQINWDKAVLLVGLSDPKGIAHISPLRFAGRQLNLAPGTRVTKLLTTGFHATLNGDPIQNADFGLDLKIKGSEGFRLAPVGESSQMTLSSPWAHPSFYGELLPASRKISDKGFEAKWSIPHLVRSYPQNWILNGEYESNIASFSAGVRLFEPVTLYTEATRAVKYGFLFVALTFLMMVLVELVTGARPSIIQYVIIGGALALFYLLLIALSEHIGFNLAYGIAAALVVAMNTLYCMSVLRKKTLSLVVMVVLAALYVVLFMILRAEDYALLTGAILLFIALAVTMYVTRNLNRTTPSL